MLDEGNKNHNFANFEIGDAVLTGCFPLPQLLIRQVALVVESLEMSRLRDGGRPDLSSDGHLWHIQRPLLGDFLGGGARVLTLTHQVEPLQI